MRRNTFSGRPCGGTNSPRGFGEPFITKDSAAWGRGLSFELQLPGTLLGGLFFQPHPDETDGHFDIKPLLSIYMDTGSHHAKELLGIRGILFITVGVGPMGLVTTRWPLDAPTRWSKGTLPGKITIDGGYKFLGQENQCGKVWA